MDVMMQRNVKNVSFRSEIYRALIYREKYREFIQKDSYTDALYLKMNYSYKKTFGIIIFIWLDVCIRR